VRTNRHLGYGGGNLAMTNKRGGSRQQPQAEGGPERAKQSRTGTDKTELIYTGPAACVRFVCDKRWRKILPELKRLHALDGV